MTDHYVPAVRRGGAFGYRSLTTVLRDTLPRNGDYVVTGAARRGAEGIREIQHYARLRDYRGMSASCAWSLATAKRHATEGLESFIDIDVSWDYDDEPCDCDTEDGTPCDDVSYIIRVTATMSDLDDELCEGYYSLGTSLGKDDDIDDYIWATVNDYDMVSEAVDDLAASAGDAIEVLQARIELIKEGVPSDWAANWV